MVVDRAAKNLLKYLPHEVTQDPDRKALLQLEQASQPRPFVGGPISFRSSGQQWSQHGLSSLHLPRFDGLAQRRNEISDAELVLMTSGMQSGAV
ncbi:hypothetical protein CH341_04455 [Rhodoplanes roseus]|uniref:Uncharacterized protein n=1 Tax=Rhodoplanes roseus TaxID=29409 RepID=A0A327L429_9BRAD|nr:hypothetical protein CH341_04455 [Rhodoplanes roseus]